MADERWKPIPGHRGYEASSLGRVRSVDRVLRDGRRAGGVVLAQQPDRDGYLTVQLGGKRVRVSRVVLLAFQGPAEGRHLNGRRDDNRPENLAWGSRLENERDKRKQKDGEITEVTGIGSRPPRPVTAPITSVTSLVTLKEAVADGYVSCSLQALRIARHRGLLPQPRGMRGTAHLFDPAELAWWDAARGSRAS